MSNKLIPVEERHLTPEQVDVIDRRRRRGQLLLVILASRRSLSERSLRCGAART